MTAYKYKFPGGTSEKFFDVLYIDEDGAMKLEHHNSQRVVSWPARLEDGQFGQVVRYGKGSSIPFTDQKGNMRPRWSVLTAEQVAEIFAPSPTPSHEHANDYGCVVVPTGTESPSDAVETDTDGMPTENEDPDITDEDRPTDETEIDGESVRNLTAILNMMANNKVLRELAKGFGILAALAIIWQTGLLIPFALLGGVAAGVVK